MVKKYHSLLLICLSFVCLDSMAQQKQTPKPKGQFTAARQFSNTKLSYKIIPAVNHTFSFDVLACGKILNHQISKPG